MKQKRVIVVGAGVAGLVAAIYAGEAGHDVMVLEQGLKTGGHNANWRRKRYHFESGPHWMLGTSPRLKTLFRYWTEVGGLSKSNHPHIDDKGFVLYHNRNILPFYRNLDTFHSDIIRRSPRDKNAADALYCDINLFKLFMDEGKGLRSTLLRIFLAIPFAVHAIRLWKMSSEEYVSSFKDDEIRTLLLSNIAPSQTAIFLVITLAAFSLGDCGYPRGGSLILTTNLENKAKQSGCAILCHQFVSKIVVNNDKVKGVISNGDFYPADDVVVACDTTMALDKFFEDSVKRQLVSNFRDIPGQQCMLVCFGVRANLFRYHMNMRIMLDEPLDICGTAFNWLEVYNYAECKEYAPYGCTSLTVVLKADCYDYWMQARNDGTYIEKKNTIINKVAGVLKQQIPLIKDNIEVSEMSTPLTYERFTSSFRGRWRNLILPGEFPKLSPFKSKICGLHFAGRSTMLAGGQSAALLSGRAAAKSIS